MLPEVLQSSLFLPFPPSLATVLFCLLSHCHKRAAAVPNIMHEFKVEWRWSTMPDASVHFLNMRQKISPEFYSPLCPLPAVLCSDPLGRSESHSHNELQGILEIWEQDCFTWFNKSWCPARGWTLLPRKNRRRGCYVGNWYTTLPKQNQDLALKNILYYYLHINSLP